MRKKLQQPAIQTDKITPAEIVLLKSAISSTDAYLENPVKPDKTDMGLRTESRFDFVDNTARFRLHILLDGQNADGIPLGLEAEFTIDYYYIVENLPDFIVHHNGDTLVHPILGATLLGISFSTSRGIVMERTKGTPLAGFILPVINPMQTLFDSQKQADTPAKTARKRKKKEPAK